MQTFVYRGCCRIRTLTFQGKGWGLRKERFWKPQSLEDREAKLIEEAEFMHRQ